MGPRLGRIFLLGPSETVGTCGQEDRQLLVGVLVCWAEERFLLNLIDLRELRKIFNVEVTWSFSCI